MIKFLKSIAGDGFSYGKGSVANLEPDLEKSFINSKIAEKVENKSSNISKTNKSSKRATKSKRSKKAS